MTNDLPEDLRTPLRAYRFMATVVGLLLVVLCLVGLPLHYGYVVSDAAWLAEGSGSGWQLGSDISAYLGVSGAEARAHARLLARTEGIFAGFSSGANFAAAVRLLKGPERGGCVAIVMCDSGLKYLSTDLWEDA